MNDADKERLRKWLDSWPKLSHKPDGYEPNAEVLITCYGHGNWVDCMLVSDRIYYSVEKGNFVVWYERKVTPELEIRLKGE